MIDEAEKTIQEPEARRVITNLAGLRGQPVNAQIPLPDGEIVEIPVRTLSYAEWQRVEREVPQPAVPVLVNAKGSFPDRNNPEYIQAMALWNEQVMYRRILASLDFPVEGETVEEKLKNLQDSVSTPIMMGLIAALSQVNFSNRASVVARSKTFQP